MQDLGNVDDVYRIHTSREVCRFLNVLNAAGRQVVVVKSLLISSHGFDEYSSMFTSEETQLSKRYLKLISTTHVPPALAEFQGLNSKPLRLYRTVVFDKLHVVDLGVERMLPDMAFGSSCNYLTTRALYKSLLLFASAISGLWT